MSKKVIVIGGSAGSLNHIITLMNALPNNVSASIILIIHLPENPDSTIDKMLSKNTKQTISYPEDSESIQDHKIYLAPPMYHLQVETDYTFSFSLDERVHYSRPSISVLLETVARAYKSDATVIILSGASSDGADGARVIEQYGGTVLIQDPEEAEAKTMVTAAIQETKNSKVLTVENIIKYIIKEMS